MAIVQDWLPPTRENYEQIVFAFKYGFAILGLTGWIVRWYGMGKTSVSSPFNVPGRVGWMMMELPGPIILIYLMWKMPSEHNIDVLPWQNLVLAGLFVFHYLYRAVGYPLMQPSMSPIHPLIILMAMTWQFLNATSLGAWLAAYGSVRESDWSGSPLGYLQFVAGITIWWIGLSSNFFHDEELRSIRRREQKRIDTLIRENGGSSKTANGDTIEKHYRIPEAGLFRYILFPHYLSEWFEWLGFWMAAGWGCVPARSFFLNEVLTMAPRARNGRDWYVDKFGEDKIGGRAAVIPGLL